MTIAANKMHILYCGNWLQLGPTIGPTLFTQPSPNAFRQNWVGYSLDKKINHLVYLTKIM
jgi:hypothetical protein